MPPKGEFEVTYFGGTDNTGNTCGGLDYSRPYTALDKNHLAPGSVNLQNINGFLCSSPWLGTSPYATSFSAGEFVIGISPVYYSNFSTSCLVLVCHRHYQSVGVCQHTDQSLP